MIEIRSKVFKDSLKSLIGIKKENITQDQYDILFDFLRIADKEVMNWLNETNHPKRKFVSVIKELERENKKLKNEIERLTLINPETRHKMCGKKKSFTTKQSAEKTAELFGGGRVYKCPICFCFHVTTKVLHNNNQ